MCRIDNLRMLRWKIMLTKALLWSKVVGIFYLTLSSGEEMVVLLSYNTKSNVLGTQMWRHGFGNRAKGGAKIDWFHNWHSWDLVRTRKACKDNKKMEYMIWNYWTQLGRNARNQKWN